MIVNLILAVSAFTVWTAATRFLFQRWTRKNPLPLEWPSGRDMHPGWMVLGAAVTALTLPAVIPVIVFGRVVMHNPARSRKAKTMALQEENDRLRREQERLLPGPVALDDCNTHLPILRHLD